MKHGAYIITAVLLSAALCACTAPVNKSSQKNQDSSQNSQSVSRASYDTETIKNSETPDKTSSETQDEQTSEPEHIIENSFVLPEGIKRVSKKYLSYQTSILSLSVSFPEEFHIISNDYRPEYGVYLQNDTGTATLLIEAVSEKDVSYRQIRAYILKKYPDAQITVNNKKELICKAEMTDNDGNIFCQLQKYRIVKNGYHLAAICCRTEDKDKYIKSLSEISLS
ncbi:MAG: hypothetical protein II059_05670 [Clostridia bacterium]|nr:hypothetical protein [Clostridia bacterium]